MVLKPVVQQPSDILFFVLIITYYGVNAQVSVYIFRYPDIAGYKMQSAE